MEITLYNIEKSLKMSKKDLVKEIVGICLYIVMDQHMIDEYLNKKQVIVELNRALYTYYTKYEKRDLLLIIFYKECRLATNIKYILEKRINTFHEDEYKEEYTSTHNTPLLPHNLNGLFEKNKINHLNKKDITNISTTVYLLFAF